MGRKKKVLKAAIEQGIPINFGDIKDRVLSIPKVGQFTNDKLKF